VETVREEKMLRAEKTSPLSFYQSNENILITSSYPKTFHSFSSKQRIKKEAAQ